MGDRLLILGRAGSGKTRRLTDRVAEALRAGLGRRTLLLVPTLSQASHLKRLVLTRYEDLTGFFDESIVTFTSLAERVFPGRPIRDLLSGRRQELLLLSALERDPPVPFRRVLRYPGFRRSALAFVKELKQNGLPAGEVADRLSAVAEARPGAARERMEAFRDLFLSYEGERVRRGLTDHEDFLRDARDALRDGAPLEVDYLGVDGFQNFTRLERDLLLALARRAGRSEVTLPWDPALDAEGGRQFSVASETRGFLASHGFTDVFLAGNRRARAADLARIERDLFEPRALPAPPDGSVRAIPGADLEDEADRVARAVLGFVVGEGRAWRDVVIVVRDAAAARDRFRQAFRRHGIPLRVYAKDSLGHHPFVRAVRHLLALARGEASGRRLLALLRSGFVPGVARAEADRIEYELLGRGTPGDPAAWEERLRPFSAAAADLAAALAAGPLPAGPAPAARTAAAVLDLVRRRLSAGRRGREDDPDHVRAEALAREGVRAAAEEVAGILGPGEEAPERFLDLFLDSLRELAAWPRDRRLNVVNLIDAREARQWEAPAVVVAGLVEGEFPRNPREDIFLADRDRRWVNERGDLSLRERELEREEEGYLFYVAMTRARERLWLSWPATDAKGEATLPSLFVRDVLSLFPAGGEGIVSLRRLSEPLPRAEETADREDLRRRALLRLAEPVRPGTAEEAGAREGVALHDLLVGVGGGPPDPAYARAARLAARFWRPPPGRLADPGEVLRRHGPGTPFGVSALEEYASCPFLHFAKRTLGLREPPRSAEDGLDALLLGEIGHAVLERLFLPAKEGGPLPSPDDVDPVLESVWAEKASGVPPGLVTDRARASFRLALCRAVAEERGRLEAGGWRPRHLEAGFEVRVEGGGGEPVRVTGRVDRIDEDRRGRGVVIDYKSSAVFDARMRKRVDAGVHLQLPLYLLAVREWFDLDPAGAWLHSLRRGKRGGFVTEAGLLPGRSSILDGRELGDLLSRTRERVAAIAERIRAGRIEARPHDPDDCRRCDFADVCRFEAWMAEDEGEARA